MMLANTSTEIHQLVAQRPQRRAPNTWIIAGIRHFEALFTPKAQRAWEKTDVSNAAITDHLHGVVETDSGVGRQQPDGLHHAQSPTFELQNPPKRIVMFSPRRSAPIAS